MNNNMFVKLYDLEGKVLYINRNCVASFSPGPDITAIVISTTSEQNGYVWVQGDATKALLGVDE